MAPRPFPLHTLRVRRCLLTSGLCLLAACAAPRVACRVDGDEVHVTLAGEPFATVRCGAEPRPCVWPLFAPGGVAVTRGFPLQPGPDDDHDHPHHVSLWFAHGAVDGHDFWQGKAQHERQQLDGAPEVDGDRVVCHYRWLVGADTVVATERRTLTFGGVAGADGARTLDVEVVLQAGPTPLLFGDSKEGTFALRLRPELQVEGKVATGQLLDSEGRSGKAVWGRRARWIAAAGVADGRPVGVALFDHPDNLRHPTWWHARSYGLLAANAFGTRAFEGAVAPSGDFRLPAGGRLRLCYRVLLHGAGWSAGRLDAAYAAWAGR